MSWIVRFVLMSAWATLAAVEIAVLPAQECAVMVSFLECRLPVYSARAARVRNPA